MDKKTIKICTCSMCNAVGAQDVLLELRKSIEKSPLKDDILIKTTGSSWLCTNGPTMIIEPDGIVYEKIKPKDIDNILESIESGKPYGKNLYKSPDDGNGIPKMDEIPFISRQELIVLENRGIIDPNNIDEYIAQDGYKALKKVIDGMSGDEVIEEISQSGLRGRGGAGFPTGRKWKSRQKMKGDIKYVVCNADEGDPGAFMDRSILESDPHAIIEGMAIGAFAVGASKGYVYVRTEYPLAIQRLKVALKDAEEKGFLGDNIMGTEFSLHLKIFRGAGAFVCGETTALARSIEGKTPEPRQRPPRTSLFGKPVVINNVETWANVPRIINRGADWFSKIGTEKSKGTKVFSLAGNIYNAGLVEVPMGITLRELVYDIGGGIPDGGKFKAVQTGGPSGGVIPAKLLDLPIDYERLEEAYATMGSGGMIIMDDKSCMVDVARYFLKFTIDESCGKCTSCREGTVAMYEILTDIIEGRGKDGDLEFLEELAIAIKDASLCGLGQSAPNPVISSLRHFREEYQAHIKDKKCPAKSCKELIYYKIDAEKCTGCFLCNMNCPTNAIIGNRKEIQNIVQPKCIKCGVCLESCNFDAVIIEDNPES
ncbi:MAG: NADH-ubiquinone oxidoreductase-F iron-sulfur binding region domain-containing protein [Candidatus Zixiibacteriota bacterium]